MELLERLKLIEVRYEEMVATYDRQLAEFERSPRSDERLVNAMRSTRAAALRARALASESVRREERIRERQLANRSRAPFSPQAATC